MGDLQSMLHHREIGTGTPIVLLHGVTVDHRHMMDVMEPCFRGAGAWRRIYVDMPGHGLSPARNDIQSQDDLLSAMQEFIEAKLPAERFAVAGLSRGSYIARGLVHTMPERISGVALIVPGGNPSSDPKRIPDPQVIVEDKTIQPELSEAEIWAHENMSVIQRWDIVEKRRQIIAPARALFDEDQEARIVNAFEFSFAAEEEATTVNVPSLVVVGRQDSISGYLDGVDIMHRFPRATFAVLDSAGHALAWERPEVFHALVRDWLDRL
ncbi:MAG: alpha/beta hydrolase [Falsiruegeria mediterranea]